MTSLKPQTNLATPQTRPDAQHLVALDALRGFAIVLVVIGHYLPGHVVGGTPAQLPALAFIGAVSYSWYLYHGGLGYPLMDGLEVKFLVPPFVSTLIAAAVTFVVAWLSYRVVEQPGIRLGRTLERRVLNSALRVAAEHAAKR